MYSDVKNVQILIALLKEYGIRHIVLSPGNRNVPIAHSVEEDEFFHCYSITDERSAGFFAIGLIHKLHEPVVICCTSGTAVCNYASAVNEAFYQKLPLVVVTADRNPYFLNQLEDQMVPQTAVFAEVCKKTVQLPIVKDEQDEWRCQNLINTALLEIGHHGNAPIHINIPIEKGTSSFNTPKLPSVRKIDRFYAGTDESKALSKQLEGKNVFVLYGQSAPCDDFLKRKLETFAHRYNCVIGTDLLSNLHCEGALNTFLAPKILDKSKLDALVPDIVISCGGNFISNLRPLFRDNCEKVDHWLISESGEVQDPFHCLTKVIEGSCDGFFSDMATDTEENSFGDYYTKWKQALESCVLGEIPYSDMLVVQKFMKHLKAGDKLHLANSSSVRIANNFQLNHEVEVTCNRGTNGIDGSMSTFVGEASFDEALHYLLIGDLSFFYDMNALWNRYIGKNIRVLLNNNQGAEIFHFTIGTSKVPTINKHIAAEHFYSAKGWAESAGMKYLSIKDESEIDEALKEFTVENSDVPIFLEVFTEKDKDAKVMHRLYDKNKKPTLKQTIKKLLH